MSKQAVVKKDDIPPPPPVQAPPVTNYAAASAAMLASLPKRKYTIPESARLKKDIDPKVVVVRELTTGEIDMAYQAGGGSNQKATEELAKFAIVSVDGRQVNAAEAEMDILWPKWSSKVRTLCKLAWKKLHMTDEAEDDAFFASEEAV